MIVGHASASASLLAPVHLATVLLGVAAMAAYRWATDPPAGVPRSHRSRVRLRCWQVAVVSLVVVELPPMEQWVEASFAAHMVQHLVLVSVSAPLIVLARPGAALGAGLRRLGWPRGTVERAARLVRPLASPVACWAAVVGYIWVVHFSAIYDLALDHAGIHLLEHLGFLVAAVLGWLPVLGPRHLTLPDPLKVLYVLVLMPALAFCGLAIFSADHLMFTSYAARPDALDDQRLGGMAMWILPGAALLPLGLALVVRWWRREEQAVARAEQRVPPSVEHRRLREASP